MLSLCLAFAITLILYPEGTRYVYDAYCLLVYRRHNLFTLSTHPALICHCPSPSLVAVASAVQFASLLCLTM